MGGKILIEEIKVKFGIMAKGMKTLEQGGTLQLRGLSASYNTVSDTKTEDIDPENAYYRKTN